MMIKKLIAFWFMLFVLTCSGFAQNLTVRGNLKVNGIVNATSGNISGTLTGATARVTTLQIGGAFNTLSDSSGTLNIGSDSHWTGYQFSYLGSAIANLNSSGFYPQSDGSGTLGTTSQRWSNLYLTQGENCAGTSTGMTYKASQFVGWVSNRVTLIASNAATAQADFTTTEDYVSTDVMRANLAVQLTNGVTGRTITFYLTGDTNANNRTVSVSTNGMTGCNVVNWNFNTPTNGSSDFTVTNNMRAELSIKYLGQDGLCTNHFWAIWGPVR